MPHRTTGLTEDDDKEIARLHIGGMRLASLARKFGVFPSSIRAALRFQNVPANNHKMKANEKAFTDFRNEKDCYWLGFIYADGGIHKTGGLAIGLKFSDEGHLQKLHKYLELENKLFVGGSYAKGVYHKKIYLKSSNYDLVQKLEKLGVETGRPNPLNAIRYIPNEMLHHFFRGMFDGDGCAHKIPRMTFLSQKELLEVLRNELLQRGLVSSTPTVKQNGKIFRIEYQCFKTCTNIKNYLYKDATVFLERKKLVIDSWNPQTRSIYRKNRAELRLSKNH